MDIADVLTPRISITGKKKSPRSPESFRTKFHTMKERYALQKAWADRNLGHGEVFMESLEIPYIFFGQNIFVEESEELVGKLSRIGYDSLYGFPDEKLFEGFSRILYNKKHNIAISLYKPEHKEPINTAIEIAKQCFVDGEYALTVFIKAVNILMSKQQPSTKKQVLLG